MIQINTEIINKKHWVSTFYQLVNLWYRSQISRGRESANKYPSILSWQSKKMQQSTHSHLHMAGQRNHRTHTPYYRLQEHHVIPTKPSLVISTHDFIRSNQIIPPPSSFCRVLTLPSLTPTALFVTPFMSPGWCRSIVKIPLSSDFALHQGLFQ